MIKLVLIIIILLAIAIFRIARSIVRTVSNELPFWTDAARKILSEVLEEDNDEHAREANNSFKRTIDIKHRSLFLRDRCSMNGSKLLLIPDREQVEVIAKDRGDLLYEIESNWYRVRYKGLNGCSFGGFLEL